MYIRAVSNKRWKAMNMKNVLGGEKKFEDEDLEALLEEDCCQAHEELAEIFRVTQAGIWKLSKAMRR